MSEEEGSDANPQGKLTSKNLLTVILEFENKIRESEASRKMGFSLDIIHEWAEELETEGFIEIAEREVGDPLLKVTPTGLKKLTALKEEWIEKEGGDEEKKAEPKETGGKPRLRIDIKGFFRKVRGLSLDIIILCMTLASLYLLKQFVDNPNAEALSFLLGSLLLSFTFLLYNQYKKSLKTRKFIGFIQWIMQLIQTKRRYIASVFVSMMMIYAVGMFIIDPVNRSFYIMAMVLIASTGMIIYYPKKNLFGVLKFYVGITLLAYALMLLVNWVSITATLFDQKVRLLDVGVGMATLILVQLNENWLGIKARRLS